MVSLNDSQSVSRRCSSLSSLPGLMMSKGFASASAQQANRPKTLEAIVLSQRLNDCFASLQDPRVERTRLHQLVTFSAILAVLSGGNGWEDMEI